MRKTKKKRPKQKGNERLMKRQFYVFVSVDDIIRLWPYPEVLDFFNFKVDKEDLLYLTFTEFSLIDLTLKQIQSKSTR